MKHGKKLKRKHKDFLSGLKLDPAKYLLERQDNNTYSFININTGKVKKFNLDGSRY